MQNIKTFKRLLLFLFFLYLTVHPADTFANECIKGDCINGYGIYQYNSGRQYVGEWKNGRRHGYGTLSYPYGSKYTGEWKNGRMHGQGIKIYPDGSKYAGEWKNGNKHGQGMMLYARGSQYFGGWKNGSRHGKGEMIYQKGWEYSEGTKYAGEWKNDKKNGKGIFTIPGGAEYIGEWRNDKMYGQGTMNYANVIFKGKWKYGVRGQGTLICPDGSVYRGSEWRFAHLKFKELKEWRLRNGYSLQQVAKALKIKHKLLSIYEGGELGVFNHMQIVLECLAGKGQRDKE